MTGWLVGLGAVLGPVVLVAVLGPVVLGATLGTITLGPVALMGAALGTIVRGAGRWLENPSFEYLPVRLLPNSTSAMVKMKNAFLWIFRQRANKLNSWSLRRLIPCVFSIPGQVLAFTGRWLGKPGCNMSSKFPIFRCQLLSVFEGHCRYSWYLVFDLVMVRQCSSTLIVKQSLFLPATVLTIKHVQIQGQVQGLHRSQEQNQTGSELFRGKPN